MSFDHIVAVLLAIIAFLTLVVAYFGLRRVAEQIRDGTKERRSKSLSDVYGINRQLISLGFFHPQLFGILADAKDSDPVWERYYLQVWLNQLSEVHSHLKNDNVDPEYHESLERDISYFMDLQNMRRHWARFHQFYPASFQKLVNDIVKSKAPPKATAHVKPS